MDPNVLRKTIDKKGVQAQRFIARIVINLPL